MSYSPKFFAEATELHRSCMAELGAMHPLTQEVLDLAIEMAPPGLIEGMEERAQIVKWLPKRPDAFTENGEVVLFAETLARLSGLDVSTFQSPTILYNLPEGCTPD